MLTADPTVVSEVVNEALALAEQTTRDAISKEAALAQLQGQYAELRRVAAARVVPPKGPQVELAVEQLKLAGLLDEDMSLEKAATYVKDPTNLLDLVIQITAPPAILVAWASRLMLGTIVRASGAQAGMPSATK